MRVVLISLLTLFSTITFAQLQKGNYLLGGSVFAFASKGEPPFQEAGDKEFYYSLTPRIGYLLTDKIVIGTELEYESRITKSSDSSMSDSWVSREETSQYSAMPFIRNYIPVGEKFALFFHNRFGLSYSKTNDRQTTIDQGNGSSTTSSYQSDNLNGSVNINIGTTYFISTKWSVEVIFAALSYSHRFKQFSSSSSADNTLYLSYGLSAVHFGTAFYFNR